MQNPVQAAWSFLKGDHLPGRENKFAPADPTVNWSYINHLVYTANTLPYGGDGTGDGNSAVFACLLALASGSIEPPLGVYRKDVEHGGEFEPLPDNPLQDFLDNPNEYLDILELRFWVAWSKHSDGNAYLVKTRAGSSTAGLPISLWPASPMRMEPWTEKGSPNFIDYYRYQRGDGNYEAIPVENVLHFKLGVDPIDPRRGLAPIKRLIREIASDAEATKYMDTLLRNFGTPGLVVTPPPEAILSPDQINAMKAGIAEAFGGTSRGKVSVLTGGANMEQFGFSPEQLNLKVLHDFPETRIAAVMGVDPLVARLGVGLEQTSNYASARQVRENFTELTLGPNWKMDEAVWNRKLKPDFSQDRAVRIRHDLSEVRALQEDENAKATRIAELFKAGIIPQQVAAKELGYDPEWEAGSLFYVATNMQFVEASNIETDPEVEAQRQADAAAARLTAGPQQPAAPGSKSGDAFAEVLQAVVDHSVNGFADDLQRLQEGQKRRLEKALSTREPR